MPVTNKNGMSATIGDSASDVKSEIVRQTWQPCRSSRTLTEGILCFVDLCKSVVFLFFFPWQCVRHDDDDAEGGKCRARIQITHDWRTLGPRVAQASISKSDHRVRSQPITTIHFISHGSPPPNQEGWDTRAVTSLASPASHNIAMDAKLQWKELTDMQIGYAVGAFDCG